MPKKSLRILIADPYSKHCESIDKLLSRSGYQRVCLVDGFNELSILAEYSPSMSERFDVLIINSEIFNDALAGAVDFCLQKTGILKVIVYDTPALSLPNEQILLNGHQKILNLLSSFNGESKNHALV